MSFGEDVYPDQLYTEQQSKLLTILPRFLGSLSVVGSSTILYIILNDRKHKLRRVYHRLLLAYSTIDVLCSFKFSLSALVVPRGTPGVWGARGTVATCEASGFVTQFSFSLGVYATFICLYYVLVLRYKVRERTLARRVEPFVHAVALITPLVLGINMLLEGNYNPTNAIIGWCFINVYPMDCLRREEITCERGEEYYLWLVLNNLPFPFFFIVVVASCCLTYTKVRSLINRGTRWSLTQSRQSAQSVKDTKTHAFLYIAAFFTTYIFFGIGTILGPSPPTKEHRNFYLPIVMLVKIFLPLQGFWNCFIYIRPRFTAVWRRHPRMPLLHILRIVLNSIEDFRIIPQPSNGNIRSSWQMLENRWRSSSFGFFDRVRVERRPFSSGISQEAKENSRPQSTSSNSPARFSSDREEVDELDDNDEFMPEFNRCHPAGDELFTVEEVESQTPCEETSNGPDRDGDEGEATETTAPGPNFSPSQSSTEREENLCPTGAELPDGQHGCIH